MDIYIYQGFLLRVGNNGLETRGEKKNNGLEQVVKKKTSVGKKKWV